MQGLLLFTYHLLAYLERYIIVQRETDHQWWWLPGEDVAQEAEVVRAVNHFHTLKTLPGSFPESTPRGFRDVNTHGED